MYEKTTATLKVARLRNRIRAMAGGTSASKTVSTLLVLIDRAQIDTEPKLTTVVSESMPHLKRGVMRDFEDIMKTHGYWNEDAWNRTDSIYTFHNGSRIEFFGADSPDKLRGPRRDRLFINEANNIPYDAFNQLEVRTKECVYLDWNPTNEFWFYTDLLPSRPDDIDFITLTYKDNESLDPAIVQSIESRRNNKAWWTVYGMGQLGDNDARIYTGWQVIDAIPFEARLVRRGLDFGYTNDPSSIVDVYEYNGGLIFDERLYQRGMSNKQLADFISRLDEPKTLVMADSAEPKSIDEIKSYGVTILPVVKGPDSVRQGIQRLQEYKVAVTKDSVNLIKEYRNYIWMTDRDGRTLNVPMGGLDHALDAARYGLDGYREINRQAMRRAKDAMRRAHEGY